MQKSVTLYLVSQRANKRNTQELVEVETVKFIEGLPTKYAHQRNGGRPALYKELYETLKSNPNKWAEFRTYTVDDNPKACRQAYNFVANCRRGAVKHLAPTDNIEIVCVPRGNGTYTLFLRYVG